MRKISSILCLFFIFEMTAQLDADSVMGLPVATTTALMNGITGASTGSMLYNLEENKVFVFDGTSWVGGTNPIIVSTDANNDIIAGGDGGAFYDAPTVRVFDAYDNAGGIAANETGGTYNILNLDNIRTNQSGFTLAVDRITIPEDGIYEITYSVTFVAGTNQLSTVETIIFVDDGSGFTEVDGSSSYSTLVANGFEDTAAKSFIIDLDSGDVLVLASNRTGSTAGAAVTVADGTNITIKKLN